MNLSELKPNQRAIILNIGAKGELEKRLVDMGVVSGEIITREKVAPLGDPTCYTIKATHIALRKEDAKNIDIELIKE